MRCHGLSSAPASQVRPSRTSTPRQPENSAPTLKTVRFSSDLPDTRRPHNRRAPGSTVGGFLAVGPMRVCLIYDCLFPYTVGGAERWYRNLAERLVARGSRGDVSHTAPVAARRAL